ncbi:WhiB family transcriptional regulator [Streptacidiphilus jiangxiensis]|uniref:Transcription factor WhiB n=1 Tax=Streptacidiphilus jiangxiensis TaxID=235985 RepID=A0A1H7H1N5_STRJI|nr:WhiB family transcriptional regulator [Streptacidiphilus jiangxiensis]SEK44158.1 Transcription factor WhiB [Streptacidiphilus jiangxiensis]
MNVKPTSAPELDQIASAVDAWSLDAACAYADDPDVFFSDVKDPERIRHARTVCRDCPVIDPCLLEAVSRPKSQDVGVRACTVPEERSTMRARGLGRCDPERVERVLAGARGHLSPAERDLAVVRTIQLGLPAERLARALDIQLPYARRKIADERRAIALRAATNPGRPRRRAREAA